LKKPLLNNKTFRTFAQAWFVLSLIRFLRIGGKSGQHRAPYFLTGSLRSDAERESATENNRPDVYRQDKGENAR